VAKILRPLHCLKTWDTDHPVTEGHIHPYKSLKTQIKLFLITHHWSRLEVSSGYKQKLQTSAGHSSKELITEYGMSPESTRHNSAGRVIYLQAASVPYYG